MVGGGVETTGGRDQFPGHLHAHQHLAPCFAVVAGGLENVGDGLGRVAVLQETEDGLPIGRTDGLSSVGFLVRPLRGRREREIQGTPLKPRQGQGPWTPLLKNLYLKGTDGTGAQAGELTVVAFTQPVDGGDACFRGENVISQDAWLRAEGMFGGDEELAAVVGWVGNQQQARASGLEQGRGGTR